MKWNWLDLTFEMSDFPHNRIETKQIFEIHTKYIAYWCIFPALQRPCDEETQKIESLTEIHLWKKQKLSNKWTTADGTAEIRIQLIWDICVIKDFEIRMIRYVRLLSVHFEHGNCVIDDRHFSLLCEKNKPFGVNLLAWINIEKIEISMLTKKFNKMITQRARAHTTTISAKRSFLLQYNTETWSIWFRFSILVDKKNDPSWIAI